MGHLLDELGITVDLEQDEHLVDAVLLGKLVSFGSDDDRPRLIISSSDGLDWISAVGLVHAADTVINSPAERTDE